jgi:hypothetical protein
MLLQTEYLLLEYSLVETALTPNKSAITMPTKLLSYISVKTP